VAERTPNPATGTNTAVEPGIPGSAVPEHPMDGIPLPAHGFTRLDDPVQLASVPAVEVISRAALVLLDSAADRLGLAPGREPDLDMDEARRLINALAGLLAAAEPDLGDKREPLLAGLRTVQNAFREASVHPDAPGTGPGEQFLS
jgi:Domain of unknown function (DUF1844)